jgi:superfamily II DNA or RNA helicase
MRLTEIDIRQAVRNVDFTHGKALFENGFVQSCSIESEDELALTIISMVASEDVDEDLRSYVQTIYLRRKFGKVKINGTCTCKSPLNCRHIVAASLYHLYNSNNTEPFQQLSEWIGGIKKNLISKQGVKKAEQEYCLTYRIFDSDTQEKEGDLRIYKSKILKNGEVTGGLVCSTHNVLYGNGYSDLLTKSDWQVIGLCIGIYNPYNKAVAFQGSLGAEALRILIKTNRCFYAQSSVPLQLSHTSFNIEFDWVYAEDGSAKITTNIKNTQILIPTNPIMMIDVVENTLSETSGGIDPHVLQLLIKHSFVSDEHTSMVYEELGELCRLPVPRGYMIETIECNQVNIHTEENNGWFSLSFDVDINGASITIAPFVISLLSKYPDYDSLPSKISFEVEKKRFMILDKVQMEPFLKTIFELHDKKTRGNLLEFQKHDSHLIADLNENIIWKGNREILELSSKLKNFSKIEKVVLPTVFTATLRDYQQEGVNWLGFLHDFGFGGILADDMGLGKTIQTLAHLSRLKEIGKLTKPSLIVLPTSLIANWKNEIKRFTPNLTFVILHGNQRHEVYDEIEKYDLILTTYALISRDAEILRVKEFGYIVLDEAQKIKNSKTQMAITIKSFSSEHRLALSGTPIENHLGELWAIFSFLMPGFLGSQSYFKKYYQIPIEKEGDQLRKEQLNRRIKPFIIRRTKEVVATELPPKSEIIKYTQFDSAQAALYESIRVMMEEKVRDAIKSSGLGKSHITILDALLKLRQVCCDPSLLSLDSAKQVKESAKLELLMDLLDELIQENRKILIFSQFTSMLSIIEKRLISKKINYTILTGSTVNREEAITKFSTGDAKVFLISLRAGGVGLNLVEADTVIHYDPWWNPAVENQATDRAYRIGQTKPVFVYKLIVENSIEQKILELQDKKKTLLNTLFDKGSPNGVLKGDELLDLLKL